MKNFAEKNKSSVWKTSTELIEVKVNFQDWSAESVNYGCKENCGKINDFNQISNSNSSFGKCRYVNNFYVEVPFMGGIAKRISPSSRGYVFSFLNWAASHGKISNRLNNTALPTNSYSSSQKGLRVP